MLLEVKILIEGERFTRHSHPHLKNKFIKNKGKITPLDILKLQLEPLIEKLNNLDTNSYQDEDLKELLMSNTVMLYFLQGGRDYQKVMDELHTAVNDYAKEFLRPPTAEQLKELEKELKGK